MVKKLLKYDLLSYLRFLFPMGLILLTISAVYRVVQFFEGQNSLYNIISTSALVMLIIAAIVCLVITFALTIIRFYRHLFTSEGYLTFTLPITCGQHLKTKIISSFLATLASFLMVIIAGIIATSGELFAEIIKAAVYLLKMFAKQLGTINLTLYIVEAILAVITAFIVTEFLIYACISIGQLAKKNRVFMAFGVYFIIYIITQVLGTVVIVFTTLFPDFFSAISDWISLNAKLSVHLGLCGYIVINLVLSLVYILISRHIMNNKLNLE